MFQFCWIFSADLQTKLSQTWQRLESPNSPCSIPLSKSPNGVSVCHVHGNPDCKNLGSVLLCTTNQPTEKMNWFCENWVAFKWKYWMKFHCNLNSIQFMAIPTYKLSISSIYQVDDNPLYLQIEQFLPQQTLLKPQNLPGKRRHWTSLVYNLQTIVSSPQEGYLLLRSTHCLLN